MNILGTVEGDFNNNELELPSFKSFQSSVEPLSIEYVFSKGCWQKLYKFLEARQPNKSLYYFMGGFTKYIQCAKCSVVRMNEHPSKSSKKVKPTMELSSLMDDAAGSDDEGDDNEDRGAPMDALLLETAYQLCSNALQQGGRISDSIDLKALTFLRNQGMVDVLEGGEIVLSRDSIKHGISVSKPVLERSLRSHPTTLELQFDLREMGWRFSDDLSEGSVAEMVALEGNPTTYYVLLTHFSTNLLDYEGEGLFHHRQSEPYYKSIELAVSHFVDEVVEIPAYKSAKFYNQLQLFLSGNATDDPREETQQRTRTVVIDWLVRMGSFEKNQKHKNIIKDQTIKLKVYVV